MGDISNKTLAILVGVSIVISLVGIFSIQREGMTGAIASTNSTRYNGTVYFEYIDVIAVTLDDSKISLGSGTLADGFSTVTLESLNASSIGGNGWTVGGDVNQSDSLRLRSDGNRYITLDMNSSTNATTFVGDTDNGLGANFTFLVVNQNETKAIANNLSVLGIAAVKINALYNTTINDTQGSCWGTNQSYGYGFETQAQAPLNINSVFVGRFDNYTPPQLLRLCNNFTWEDTKDEMDVFVRIKAPSTGVKGNHSTTIEFTATAI